MSRYRQSMAESLEMVELLQWAPLAEKELTDTEQKRREEIAQDMDDGKFKEKYGNKWKEVKMAVATKQAKSEGTKAGFGGAMTGDKGKAFQPRQLKYPKKEMLVFKIGHGVKVIDKSDWKIYKRDGFVQAEEVEESLNEDNMDLMRKAAKGAMQTIKFKDGKLKVDSFTASGIMQIYDKVNPKNKEKQR